MASVEELAEHVAGLLQMSYTENNNKALQDAQEELNEASQSEFYTEALIDISKNQSKPDSVRSSALIAIGHQITNDWENLDPRTTQCLIESVKQYLSTCTPQIKDEVIDICTKIIRNSIKFELYLDFDCDINELLRNGSVGLALDLAICMTSGFVGCTQKEISNECIEHLTARILPSINQLFTSTDDTEILASAYDIVANCLKHSACTYFNSSYNFAEIGHMVNDFMLIENMIDAQYLKFLISASNFLFCLLQRYKSLFDGDLVQNVFNTICNCVSTGKLPAQVRSTLFGILHMLCGFDEFYSEFVSPAKDVFFPDVMIPQFFLTQTDIQNAVEDPRTFIGENHKSTGDYNDVKETACMIIRKLGSMNEDALTDIYDMFREIIGEFGQSDEGIAAQNLLWAGAHMFSCIAEEFTSRFKQQMGGFISEIFDLAGHESELVRSSLFLVLSKMNAAVPLAMTTACLECIEDPSLLVQYYALKAASNFIDKMSLDSEVEECVEAFADSIDAIFGAVLNISEAFSEPGLASTLSALIRVFDDQILPHVTDIAQELIHQITAVGQSGDDDEEAFAESIKLNQTLAEIVELVMTRAPESLAEFNGQLIKQSIEALGAITNFDVADPFLETIFQMLESYNGPFDEDMWGLATVIAPFFAQAGDVSIAAAVSILCILLVRDSDFAERDGVAPEIVSFCVEQMSLRMEYPDSWNELAKLAEGLLIRIPADSPMLAEAFPQLCEMAMTMKRTINTMYNDIFGIALLFNGLLLNNFARTVETIGDDFAEFMEFWRESVLFPESVVVVVQNFAAFGDSQYDVMSAIVNMLMSDILAKSEEAGDEFDQDVDADGVVWFDFGDTLNSFHEFFTTTIQGNKELLGQLQEEFDEDLEIMNNAPAVAAKYIEMRNSKL